MNRTPARALASLARWEVLLAAFLVVLILIGTSQSPVFLTTRNFANLISAVIEVAIMSLPMALIIIAGEIDLSVESMVGLSAAVLGFLYSAGVPMPLCIVACVIVGALGGLLNGVLVTRVGLPSLVVTVGTLALYRGLALVVLESRGVSSFPDWFTTFGFGSVPGLPIPWPFVLYLGLAVVLAAVLHRTWIGRQLYAIGKNKAASRFSGVRVDRIKLLLFVLSGTVASIAGVVLVARMASARADVGSGLTLVVVTIVLLGGVDIFGGRGTIPGVVLAFFTLAVMGNVLRLANVSSDIQQVAVGLLLVVSVVIPTLARRLNQAFDRTKGGRPRPAPSVGGPGEVVPQ
jgi:rhamnose transport system permease protein